MTDSERLDLESASGAYRRRRCAGSVNLVRELRAAGKLETLPPEPDAQSGTRVHAAWAQNTAAGLSAREAQTLGRLQAMETALVDKWAAGDEYTLLGREQRLWMHQGLEPIHSGQFDVAYGTLESRRMLIMDGKTLFDEVTEAQTNDQLRELVALAHLNYPQAIQFTVAILQPWVSGEPSVAVYDQAEAELALRLLRQTIADCADPDAPRTPGAWCKHCPALHHCEEARSLVGNTFRLAKRIEAGEFALPVGEAGSRFLDSVKTAETVLSALKAAYREILLADPDALPGWYMREGKKVREITDVLKAWDVAAAYMPLDSFMRATRLSVTELENQFARTTGSKEAFNTAFDSVITLKENAPELARVSARRGRPRQLATPQPNE